MVKSPAHWQEPASDKGSAAQEERQLKPGKASLEKPSDMDWHRQGKALGVGFSGNATAELVLRGDNPAAGEYRSPKEHIYKVTDSGQGSGPSKMETQNRLAGSKRK